MIKKLIIWKPRNPKAGNSDNSSVPNDWLDNVIQVARVTAAAGELAPFPYIKGSALVFLALLEPVQVWYTSVFSVHLR